MKLKASVDYGVRAVLYLAVNDRTCSSREISEEMSIPRDYLIQLALKLRNAGVIKARPGKNGGYVLARRASDIQLGEVLDAFDNDLKHARQEMKKGRRVSESAAKVRTVHGIITDGLDCYMSSISIQDLLDAYESEGGANALIADSLEAAAEKIRG